jgi:hypothetical protein
MRIGDRLLFAVAALGLFGAVHGAAQAAPAASLSGVYFNAKPAKTLEIVGGGPAPLTAAGKAALAANAPAAAATRRAPKGQDMEACQPVGPTRILQQPYPLEIVQKGDLVVLLWEQNHIAERVYMGEKINPEEDWSYMGTSVGHWDGPALVVESALFNDMTFLDDNGLPHTDALKVERRLRTVQGGKALEILATVTDPAMYTRPWTVRAVLPRRSDIKIEEFMCGARTLETRYSRAR